MKFVKNKILLTVLALLILTPSVVAIIYHSTYKEGQIITNAATTLAVRDIDGAVYTFNKDENDEHNKMLDLFVRMEKGAVKDVSLPPHVATSPFYTVTYSVGTRETKYQYYLSKGADSAYYLDSAGNVFHINKADAEEFLVTKYAQSIYSDAKVPVLTLSGEYSVKPASAEWMYKNSSGDFFARETKGIVTSEAQDFSLDGGFSLEMSVVPDTFHIKVNGADGKEIFNGDHADIGSLKIDPGAKVSVEIEAKWYEDESRAYYGATNYKFTATVAAAAEFYAGVTSADVGEFVSITGVNVKDPSKVTFSSEPAITYTPKFVQDEDHPEYVRALLPLDMSLLPGNYVFTLSYAGTDQEINFEVTANRVYSTKPYTIDAATVTTYFTDATKEAFKTATAEAAGIVSGKKLWNGYFEQSGAVEGEGDAAVAVGQITCGFGHVREINGSDTKYIHNGVDYSSPSAGLNVPAANSGTVVYSGILELTGYTVVIDHGFGLKTWYYHMAETTVKEGDTVAKGDTVGKTGKTGFTNQNGVHVGMSVCDVFVAPYATWSDGNWSDVGIPMYNG